MKRFVACICAAALLLGSGPQVAAATPAVPPLNTFDTMPSYASTDKMRPTRSATGNSRNVVDFAVNGGSLSIYRRSYKFHDYPDNIILSLGGSAALEKEFTMAALPEGGYGYRGAVDLSSLSYGSYTLTVKSRSGTYIYTVEETTLYKNADGTYFPGGDTTSKQYNYGALQKLQDSGSPGDFEYLKEQYGTGDDRQVLQRIEQKSLELTRSCTTQREKVMAIDWWISQNIAYDMDMAGDQFHNWVATHPGDKVRLDSPLNAFTQQYALCYGFAKLTVLMMGYAGVDSVYITGRLAETTGNVNLELGNALKDDQMNHAFNAVKVDGIWYFLDSSRNVIKQYHRKVADSPATGYTDSKLAPSYMYVFPSLDFFSRTHLAMRMGAKSYGTKIAPQTIPNGWSEDRSAYFVDSTRLRNQWARVDGAPYFFNIAGNVSKGWTQEENTWRYFGDNGSLATGTLTLQEKDNTRTYQLDSQGRVIGDNVWINIAGKDRFFRNGEMLTGWQCLDGYWRYFDAEGVMYQNDKTPLVLENEGEFHFTEEGYLKTDRSGWVEFGGARHYLDGSEPRTGLQRIDGSDYLLDMGGTTMTGWQQDGGNTYLLGPDGVLMTGWQFLDGSWYYLDRSQGRYTGAQTVGGKTHYFDGQGRLSTGGWVDLGGGKRLYYAESKVKNNVARGGKLLLGWRKVDDKLRYFDPVDGVMYTGSEAMLNKNNSKWYTFDSEGVATEKK